MNKLAVVWALLLLSNSVLLLSSIRSMMAHEYYQFIPVIFVAEALLLFFRWDRKFLAPAKGWPVGLLVLGALSAVAAVFFFSPRWATLSFILFAGSWLLSHKDVESGRSLVALWPPLWLLFRIPSEAETGLVFGLQQASSSLASISLDLLGITHHRQGNIIDLPAGTLFIEEACSGVQSVFTLLFCSLFLIPLFQRSVWLAPIYVVAGAVWAMVLNLARIVVIAVALDWYGLDLSKGWQHDVLGYICLGLAVAMLLTTDRLLAVLFFPVPATNIPFDGVNPINSVWNSLFVTNISQLASAERSPMQPKFPGRGGKRSAGMAFSSLAGFSLIILSMQSWILANERGAQVSVTLESAWSPAVNLFKGKIDGLEVVSHERIEGSIDMPFGQLSDVWNCRYNQIPIQIAFSQPYPEWHDLRVCYRATAWRLLESEKFTPRDDGNWSALQCEFMDSRNRFGYVFFSGLLVSSGEPVAVPLSGLVPSLGRMIDKNIGKRFGRKSEKAAMVQIFVTADGKMSKTLLEAMQALHAETRKILRAELKSALGQ